MHSCWMWNYGDYELYHGNLVNSRRQEYGADYPPFWKIYDVERNVVFEAVQTAQRDGYVKLHLNGKGYVMIDGVRYRSGERIGISAGEHRLRIAVCNLSGLPSAYIESDVCASGKGWNTILPGEKAVPAGFEEQYDLPGKKPEEFQFAYERLKPVSEKRMENGTLFDFGKEIFGYLLIRNVKAEDKIHVSYGESCDEALDVQYSILSEDVSGSAGYKLRQRAFRYIFVTGADMPEIEVDFEYLPLEYKGSFRCDNETVNRIWDMCAYTLRLTAREVLIEAVKRDRWLWGGDAYQAFKFSNYLFFDEGIVRRSLIALRGKEPFDEHINTITDYSLYWVLGLWEYYRTYKDADFLKFIYPRAVSLMEFCKTRQNDDGFIIGKNSDWVFIDWSDIDKEGAVCAEQMLYIAANRAMSELSGVVGEENTEYSETARRLTEKVTEFFWNEEKGAFIDSYESGKNHVTRHANIFAVMYHIATEEQCKKLVKNVLENDDITKITTPYFEGYELDVMGQLGKFDYIENMLNSYWKGMLELGATTVWEEYNPQLSGRAHYEMYGNRYGKSLCHAWGASPVYLLGKYFLGVYPTSCGYETFEVKPHLGSFKFMEGKVPIKGGEVSVKMSDNQLTVTATKAGGTLVFAGRKYPLEANEEMIVKVG